MDREEALQLLRGGTEGVAEWNRRREGGVGIPDLGGTDLSEADLRDAKLQRANLYRATLARADLSGTNLAGATLHDADLRGARLRRAIASRTVFPDVLGGVRDLNEVRHFGPSTIPTAALSRFTRGIPEEFLRGCGLTDVDIEYARLSNPNLTNEELQEIHNRIFVLRASEPIQRRPVFISYSHADMEFAEEVERQLQEAGIRCWRDVHHLTAGPVEKQLHRALEERVALVILSKNSVESDWVEEEVEHARGIEKEQKRQVLCPITLDDSWKDAPWEHRLMKQVTKNAVLDFSRWEDPGAMKNAFAKLEKGLRQWYAS